MSIFGPSEDLNLNYNVISNVGNPRNRQDAATKAYVDGRPPIITIWAEESGTLSKGKYEWSFGNGATGQFAGYTMILNGKILAMSLNSAAADSDVDVQVSISINGKHQPDYNIQLSNNRTAVRLFRQPLVVKSGSTINFVSDTSSEKSTARVVALLIELNV